MARMAAADVASLVPYLGYVFMAGEKPAWGKGAASR